MKFILKILLSISFVFQMNAQEVKPASYKVIKIDSTKNSYIIDIENKKCNKSFRLISEKKLNSSNQCKKILVDKYYKFNLLFFETVIADGKEVNTVIDDKLVWQEGDKFKICTTSDLVGICYNR